MDKNTPYNQLSGMEQIACLTSYVQSAYFRRSRQLPANIKEIIETLKGDILKYLGAIPVGTLDEAITLSVLDNSEPLSPAFFFAAAKKAWYQPKTNLHQWDEESQRPDMEADTIALLDTLAEQLERMDNRPKTEFKTLGDMICNTLPAFNARREYAYLVMRCQLDREANAHFMTDALQQVNTDRMASHHHRLTKEEAATNPDVLAQSKRLAVLDWLRACNTSGKKPSDIITPNEQQYQQFRRKSA